MARAPTPPESVPRIVAVGGVTDDAVPDAYDTALHVLIDELREPQWLTWWSAASDDVLEISYDFGVEHPARITARRGGNKLRVRIERPFTGILEDLDYVALACADVENMLATVRRRAGLGSHPELPDLEQLKAATAGQIAERAALVRRLTELVDRLADRLPAWLVATLHADLDEGRTGDTLTALRAQLSHLGVELTDPERAQFEALNTIQR